MTTTADFGSPLLEGTFYPTYRRSTGDPLLDEMGEFLFFLTSAVAGAAYILAGGGKETEMLLYDFNKQGLKREISRITKAFPGHTKEGDLEVSLLLGEELNKKCYLDNLATAKLMDLSRSEYVDDLENDKLVIYRDGKGVVKGLGYMKFSL